MKKNSLTLGIILKVSLVLFLLILIILFTTGKETAENMQRSQNETLRQLSLTRSQIENVFFSRVLLVRGVVSYIETHPGITAGQYMEFCEKQIADDRYIRNLTLSQGSVIKYVYPLKGNERAVGTDLSKVESQKDTFLRARDSGEIVMSGPVQLVQGGTGLVFRIPVSVKGRYWGQASIVFNIDEILKIIFTQNLTEQYHFMLQGKDGLGEKGEFFYGTESRLNENPLSMPIQLPGGTWILYALPIQGWKVKSDTFYIVLTAGIALSFIIMVLLVYSSFANQKLKEIAYLDFLTDTPNRRLVKLHFDMASSAARRYNTMFAVVVIDLNDFKQINDSMGHDAGDFYLVEFSKLLKNSIRQNDFIFRIGGDEFLLFITGLADRKSIASITYKIRKKCSKTIQIRDKKIDFSFSLGYSIYPDDSSDLDTLLVIADRLMYAEKKVFHKRR